MQKKYKLKAPMFQLLFWTFAIFFFGNISVFAQSNSETSSLRLQELLKKRQVLINRFGLIEDPRTGVFKIESTTEIVQLNKELIEITEIDNNIIRELNKVLNSNQFSNSYKKSIDATSTEKLAEYRSLITKLRTDLDMAKKANTEMETKTKQAKFMFWVTAICLLLSIIGLTLVWIKSS